jgi:SAM-dependent methyltransferase
MIQNFCRAPLFTFADVTDYQRLRGVLASAGYTDKGILEALSVGDFPSIRASEEALLLWRTRGGTSLETLIRLFLINVPIDLEVVRRALEPVKLENLVEAGLIQVDGGSATATVRLLPYQQLVLAFDLPQRLGTDQGYDYVMGVGQSSMTLANLTVRKPARQVLDLGTGCGIQALLAARHSERVVAVDRNPRAVELAGFNAKLNGISHVQSLPGDLFEPVTGLSFDLVVANPPFVISPDERYLYRDSGMPGDQVCREIVRQVPAFLEEGGFAQILCNWVEPTGRDWREQLATWFAGSGCDVWVLRSETRDVGAYASTWIRHTESFCPTEHSGRFEEWMAYYDQLGIEAVSAGLITMRRRSGVTNWFRADDAPVKMIGPCGDFVELGFNLSDFLEAHTEDAALLNSRLRISPDVRLERTFAASGEKWSEVNAQLFLARGFAFAGSVDRLVAELVIRCDGQRRLGDLVAELASALETEPSSILPAACGIVRNLVQRGFILPP